MKKYTSLPISVKQVHRTVDRTLKEERLFPGGSRILVACSGGPDSMVLLQVLLFLKVHRKADWHIAVAVMNHQIREAALDEAAFVRHAAQEQGLEFWETSRNIPALAKERHQSVETAGRYERYAWLSSLAKEHEYDCIVTGHHRDDQAESILAHIIRGTGLKGLSGMSVVSEVYGIPLIRPLLEISKEDILTYTQVLDIAYCVDESNESREYGRNRIRHEVMPVLRRINPQIEESLCRMGHIAREDMDYIRHMTAEAAEKLVYVEAGRCSMSRRALRAQPVALQRRIWQYMIDRAAHKSIILSKSHQEQLAHIVQSGEPKNFNVDRIIIRVQYDTIEVYWQC